MVYGTLIDGYFKAGQQGISLDLFKEMKSVGLKENNFVIDSFVNNFKRSGRMEEANELLKAMMSRGLVPDRVNYTSMMDGFYKVGKE